MTKFTTLRPKSYSYLTDNSDENKKRKGTKICVIKDKNLNLKIISIV